MPWVVDAGGGCCPVADDGCDRGPHQVGDSGERQENLYYPTVSLLCHVKKFSAGGPYHYCTR